MPRLPRSLMIRLSDEDLAALARLVERVTIVKRAGIARACLRLGLALAAEDPTRILRSR